MREGTIQLERGQPISTNLQVDEDLMHSGSEKHGLRSSIEPALEPRGKGKKGFRRLTIGSRLVSQNTICEPSARKIGKTSKRSSQIQEDDEDASLDLNHEEGQQEQVGGVPSKDENTNYEFSKR